MGDTGRVPALDGLRGVAILLVVLAHAHVPGFTSGGAVGVTLFFVLSGYLITGLLTAETARAGLVDLRSFYLRRAARLGPGLLLMLAVVTVLVAAFGGFTATYGRGLAASLLYVGNLVVADGGGSNAVPWLAHTWSLAIEEQFYLAWPLLLPFALRRPRALLAAAALAGAWRVGFYAATGDFAWGYYGTLSNAFPLLVGCGLALHGRKPPEWLVLPSLAVLAVCAASGGQGWTIYGTTAAALASAVLIAHAHRSRVLAGEALGFFGAISYGLYLWHAVPLTIPDYHQRVGVAGALAVSGLAVGVAWVSLRWVEMPVRQWVRSRGAAQVHRLDRPEEARR